jgi:hypothetical protein
MIGLVVVVDGMVMIGDGLALQVASVVRSPPLSLDAVNINVVPFVRLTVFPDVHDVQVTVTALDVFVHKVPTHIVAVLLTAPAEETLVAVIVTVLDALVTDSTSTSPLLTLAISGSELLHVVPDRAVRFRVVPSLYVPVAVSCSVLPAAVRDDVEGVMLTLLKVGLTNQSQPTTNVNKRSVPRTAAILDRCSTLNTLRPPTANRELLPQRKSNYRADPLGFQFLFVASLKDCHAVTCR